MQCSRWLIHESWNNQVCVVQGDANTEVVKLPKSGGTVQRSREYHKFLRDLSIKEYFMGRSNEMQPALQSLNLSSIKLFKVPGSMTAGAGLLPASMASSVDPARLTPVEVTPDMVRRSSIACGAVGGAKRHGTQLQHASIALYLCR